jgi:predicted DsbA family dithiol-disulfide isomerase
MLTIDIYSDIICPWCFIGKRRLEKGLALAGQTATVRWHPFELNPGMPGEGIERRAYRVKKFGSWERSFELDAQAARAGRGEGLAFNFDKMTRTPNTFDAHRIVWLAGERGVQDTVVETLFRACFTDGRNLSDRAALAAVAAEGGLDRAEVDDLLASGRGGDEVMADLAKATRLGISGVPFFVFNGTFTLSGAQAPETFRAAIERPIPAGSGEACEVDAATGKRVC